MIPSASVGGESVVTMGGNHVSKCNEWVSYVQTFSREVSGQKGDYY